MVVGVIFWGGWWAFRDSNPEPTGYEPGALTIELKAREQNIGSIFREPEDAGPAVKAV